jgi:hypothetical protein
MPLLSEPTSSYVSVFKENYTENKLTEDEQELSRVFCGTVKELSHLRSFRLEEGALAYVCTD